MNAGPSDDFVAIMQAIARIAHAMDTGPTVDSLIELVTPDILWSFENDGAAETPGSAISGADALAEWVNSRRALGRQGPGSGTRHLVGSMAIDVSGPDAARSSSYFYFSSPSTTGSVLAAVGTYADQWARNDDRWRLTTRRVQL